MNLRKMVDSMNSMQKMGAFVTAVLLLVTLVLHGPWDGYSKTRYVNFLPELELPGSLIELSFLDWTTNSPIIDWFGSILHTLVAIVVILLGFLLWQYLFRTSKENISESPAPEE